MSRADAAQPGTAQRGSHVIGSVTAFDDHRGIGEITTADGTVYPFHCTAIANRSRAIAVGTAVAFEIVPGHQGRWEARAIASMTEK